MSVAIAHKQYKIMKAVKKFETFEDLKSYKSKTANHPLSLKKHNDFEKVIKDIKSNNARKSNHNRFK